MIDPHESKPPHRRIPVLLLSTLAGAFLGLIGGFIFMAIAVEPDGSGIKGSEWKVTTFLGGLFGLIIGFARNSVRVD